MQNINRVALTGNLTRDPEMRQTGGGTAVCNMRIAVNSRIKQGGEWADKANYVDVACFGSMAENCGKYLSKGRPIALDGRLDWREWETQDGGKRQALQVIADNVQFLSDGKDHGEGGGGGQAASSSSSAPPVQTAPPATPEDEDIPFKWDGPVDPEAFGVLPHW